MAGEPFEGASSGIGHSGLEIRSARATLEKLGYEAISPDVDLKQHFASEAETLHLVEGIAPSGQEHAGAPTISHGDASHSTETA